MDKKNMEDFENWVKEWFRALPESQRSSITFRKLTQGSLKRVLEFLIHRSKTDEWIRTRRDNLYLRDRAEILSNTDIEQNRNTKHVKSMKETDRHFEELSHTEARVLTELKRKLNSLCQPNSESKCLNIQLRKKSACRQYEQVMGQATTFLRKMSNLTRENKESVHTNQGLEWLKVLQLQCVKAFISITAGVETENGIELQRHFKQIQNSNIKPEDMQIWLQENLVLHKSQLQIKMHQKDDYLGILYLEQFISNQVGDWSKFHLFERRTNQHLMTQISGSSVHKILNGNRKLEILLFHKEILKQQMMFYKNFSVESFVKNFRHKIVEIGKNSDIAAGTFSDKESAEDQIIAMLKSWQSFKAQLNSSKLLTDELLRITLPKAITDFQNIAHYRTREINITNATVAREVEVCSQLSSKKTKYGLDVKDLDLTRLLEMKQGLKYIGVKFRSKHLNTLDSLLETCLSVSL